MPCKTIRQKMDIMLKLINKVKLILDRDTQKKKASAKFENFVKVCA